MIKHYVDALRDLMPLPDGVTADDSLTEPYKAVPHRLYAWPRRFAANQLNLEADAQGFFDDSTLHVRLLLTLPAKGEARGLKAGRDVSIALDDATKEMIKALHANRVYPAGSGAMWHHLVIETVLPDSVRSIETRGYGIDVSLMLSPYEPEEASG